MNKELKRLVDLNQEITDTITIFTKPGNAVELKKYIKAEKLQGKLFVKQYSLYLKELSEEEQKEFADTICTAPRNFGNAVVQTAEAKLNMAYCHFVTIYGREDVNKFVSLAYSRNLNLRPKIYRLALVATDKLKKILQEGRDKNGK